MKTGDIQTQLATANPWWRGAGWRVDDPHLRQAERAPFDYRPGSLTGLVDGGLYVLRGPRRSGKSTELKQAIAGLIAAGTDPRAIVHAPVDGWRAVDLRTMMGAVSTTFLADAPVRYWFLDEITSVTGDWPNTIKNLRDNDPRFARDTVVLTGSSSARLHEVRKALAGRRGEVPHADRTLLPMRFTDVVAAAGLQIPYPAPLRVRDLAESTLRDRVHDLLPFVADLVALWESYLRHGGFPQAVSGWRRGGEVPEGFVETLWDVVFGDAITGDRFAATQTIAMLGHLSANLASPLNVSHLARELDVTPTTVTARLADLSEHYLAWPCHLEQGLSPRLGAQSKWYFTDPLLARLAALRGSVREPELSRLSEQQVGLALVRNLDAHRDGDITDWGHVLHHRTRTRAEIDFVGRAFARVAVESKYVDDRWGRDLQTLRASPWWGVVATRSGVEWRDDAVVLPAPLLVLLLGG